MRFPLKFMKRGFAALGAGGAKATVYCDEDWLTVRRTVTVWLLGNAMRFPIKFMKRGFAALGAGCAKAGV